MGNYYKEQVKIQTIANKISRSQEISENEKFYFCHFFMNAKGEKPANINSLCEQYFFYNNYLLLLNSKILNQPITRGLPNGKLHILDSNEYLSLMSNINSSINNWNIKLNDNKGKLKLISIAKRELEKEMKYFRRSNENFKSNFLLGGRNKFNSDIDYIVMRNLFVYLKVTLFLENNSEVSRTLNINGNSILLDEEALFHIINMHYGELTKAFKSNKSFHSLEFEIDCLNVDLRNIFKLIEKSNLLNGKNIDKVIFKFKNVVYIVILDNLGDRKKRIKTFYPVEDDSNLMEVKIKNNYYQITADLGVFIEK